MDQSKRTHGMSRSSFLRAVALALPCWPALAQTAQQPEAEQIQVDLGNLRTFVELARSDIRTQKAIVVAQNIDFTADEAVEFWPLHREYEIENNKLLDRRYGLFLKYAKEFGTMTNEQATELANQAFDLEAGRTKLRRKYFAKFRKVVPALKAARFFQIEHQVNLAIDLQLAASVPLIK